MFRFYVYFKGNRVVYMYIYVCIFWLIDITYFLVFSLRRFRFVFLDLVMVFFFLDCDFLMEYSFFVNFLGDNLFFLLICLIELIFLIY